MTDMTREQAAAETLRRVLNMIGLNGDDGVATEEDVDHVVEALEIRLAGVTTFEYARFNEAAQAVWDAAHAAGRREGVDSEAHIASRARAVDMLEVARIATMLAMKLDPATNEGGHAHQVVRSALGKVPLLDGLRVDVNAAIREMDKRQTVAATTDLTRVLDYIVRAGG